LEMEIGRLIGGRPVFRSQMRPARVVSLKNASETLTPPARVAAFCGVGNPGSFFENVRRMGLEIALQRSFPDHHVYSQAEIDSLIKDADGNSLITTAKDAVKLRGLTLSCYVMEIEIAIENEAEFTRLIVETSNR